MVVAVSLSMSTVPSPLLEYSKTLPFLMPPGQSPFVLVLSLLCTIPSLHNGVGGAVNLGSVRIIQSDGVSLIRTAGDILFAQIT